VIFNTNKNKMYPINKVHTSHNQQK